MEFAGTSAHPQGLKRKYEECDWTRYSRHDPRKGFWRLPHDRKQCAAG
jgi:hypothetical protein